jgi:hypothetical protein
MNKIDERLKEAVMGAKTIATGWHNNQLPGMFLKLYMHKLYVHLEEGLKDIVETYEGQYDFSVNNKRVEDYTIAELEEMF